MARRLQSLLFFALIAGLLLALWSWSGGRSNGTPGAQAPAVASGTAGAEGTGFSEGLPSAGAVEGGSAARRSDAGAPPLPEFLPPEAIDTLALIVRDGPFPYRQDGGVFQNRERRLPQQPRGYYREYTVKTPGSPDRGARRIVTGGEDGDAPPREYYYTADHYRSFRRFEIDPTTAKGIAAKGVGAQP